MIMKDYITAKERLNFECNGCGLTTEQIEDMDGWNEADFEENSIRTVEGNWYCHIDCFRDSR